MMKKLWAKRKLLWTTSGGAAIQVALLCVFFAVMLSICIGDAYGADITWRYRAKLPEATDSIRIDRYTDYDSVGTSLITTGADSINYTIIGDEYVTHWLSIKVYYENEVTPDWWLESMGNDVVAVGDSETIPIRLWWQEAPDTSIIYVVRNTTDTVTVETLYDSLRYVGSVDISDTDLIWLDAFDYYDDDLISWRLDTWRTGRVDSLGTFDTVFVYDTLYTAPPHDSADICVVYGFIRDAFDSTIIGADIEVQHSVKRPTVDTTGASVLIVTVVKAASTDPDGYFELPLRRTNTYSDTTRGLYDIIGRYDGQQIFRFNRLSTPATGNLNLFDSLAVRPE